MKEEQKIIGEFIITVGEKESPKSVHIVKNKTVLVGRDVLLKQFLAGVQPDCTFTHISAGNGTTPWNDTQTQLVNETLRGPVFSSGEGSSVATCSAVFGAGTATGTYSEFGVFLSGTATPNSGTMWSRILYNIEVGVADPLYIDYRLTLSN